ncbi:hypothetical protein Pst134EA_009189 [Puccinia striiformis f. sp. tritici]|uniref:hypothetical protein n=1 Tax=Puccinia striiformis f. sp. tritici TaxID=168172 RepID=UPI0020072E51|nr:hypothetical protein Pst134EA_009189 [Puccinia striiformis f. sp. tritici]KAH9468655.1 hypothetical protein Pst134EA_009189 [Puccinia striiformis f. sp. tritici]
MRLTIIVSLLTLFALGQAEGSDFGFYCSRTAILPLALCVNRADTSKSYFASEKPSNPPNHGVYNSCDEGYLHECCLDRVGYYVDRHYPIPPYYLTEGECQNYTKKNVRKHV